MDEAVIKQELRNFLDSEGRLTKYPGKLRPKLFSLYYLASRFQAGRLYTEREVNELLREWHTFEDWALLRRDLYDRGFLEREQDGSHYRLADSPPELSKFGLE